MKQFADENNKIYELYIPEKVLSKNGIDKTMSQRYVYEHPNLEVNSVEKLFAKAESIAIPRIDALINTLESEYCDGKDIREFETDIYKIIPYALLFYFRSGALLTEYSAYSEAPNETRVERMLLNILDAEYIYGLTDTICNHYDLAIIVDENSEFLLSDQYVSTVALKYKNKFADASNWKSRSRRATAVHE